MSFGKSGREMRLQAVRRRFGQSRSATGMTRSDMVLAALVVALIAALAFDQRERLSLLWPF